jgi:hypothetical protein
MAVMQILAAAAVEQQIPAIITLVLAHKQMQRHLMLKDSEIQAAYQQYGAIRLDFYVLVVVVVRVAKAVMLQGLHKAVTVIPE